MTPKEFDCVILKDGRKGCLVDDYGDGYFIFEDTEHEEFDDVSIDDIDQLTYVA